MTKLKNIKYRVAPFTTVHIEFVELCNGCSIFILKVFLKIKILFRMMVKGNLRSEETYVEIHQASIYWIVLRWIIALIFTMV